MKKLLVSIIGIVLSALLLTSCSVPYPTAVQKPSSLEFLDTFPENYELAVIRTSDYGENSYLELYDKALNLLGVVEYPYTCLENMGTIPFQTRNQVYVSHRGHLYGRSGGQVISIDTITGSATEHAIQKAAVTEVCATDDRLFVVGGQSVESFFVVMDKEDNELYSSKEEGALSGFSVAGNKLVMCRTPMRESTKPSSLMIFDIDTNESHDVTLGELGRTYALSQPIDEKIYFGAFRQRIDETIDEWETRHTVGCYSLKDGTVHEVLEAYNRIVDIVSYGDNLFALQKDRDVPTGSCIYVIDKQDESLKNKVSLDFVPLQMYECNGYLYIQGYYKQTGNTCLRQYRIDGDNLVEPKETALCPEINALDRYFASGIFFRGESC